MSDLPRSAARVRDAAATLGLDIHVLEMPESTRTAGEAADACGCALGQIVKSLVFRGAASQKPYLFLVSGVNRVDEDKAAEEIGERLERPDADFVRAVTGFAIGGVAPFGHAQPLECFMDCDLLGHDVVWAAAGTPKCLFSVDPNALRTAARARTISVT
ncbi:MAG: YbaK/EbsC family protein [Hyphomicrobiales bacterium]